MEEKRLFQRILFSHDATLVDATGKWPIQILDLSLHGFLCTEPANSTMQLNHLASLVLKLDDQHSITINAKLVHIDNQLLGFDNHDIDIDSISELKRLVELNLGNDELLHRQLAELAR
ncbi:MAG: PilZ domain-containing protein [Gammaproteobacteria bacterium]|nr:PilZ domain-containing protein [Gammaproteobacteria bacterium]